jgi:hypothetical protein
VLVHDALVGVPVLVPNAEQCRTCILADSDELVLVLPIECPFISRLLPVLSAVG